MDQERTLLKRIRRGDAEAFALIYDRYAPKIYRFIYLKVSSRERAEDLCSEVFLKAWRHFGCQRSVGRCRNIQAYLYQMARNLVIDFYRQKPRQDVAIDDAVERIVDEKSNLKDDLVLNEEMGRVRKALSQLRDDYQDIIVWHYLDELTIKEIARILGKSQGAVRVMLSRALKELRELL